MSRVKYVSVVEIEGHGRQIRPGKVKRSGKELRIPTPNNDLDEFQRREWERVGVFSLPEEMPKSSFVEWWNDRVDQDEPPSPIPEVLAAVEEQEVEG